MSPIYFVAPYDDLDSIFSSIYVEPYTIYPSQGIISPLKTLTICPGYNLDVEIVCNPYGNYSNYYIS